MHGTHDPKNKVVDVIKIGIKYMFHNEADGFAKFCREEVVEFGTVEMFECGEEILRCSISHFFLCAKLQRNYSCTFL